MIRISHILIITGILIPSRLIFANSLSVDQLRFCYFISTVICIVGIIALALELKKETP